jgi:signal transduction histidine kinase
MLSADPPNLDNASDAVRRTIRDANRASEVIGHLRALFGKKREFTKETVDLNEAAREVVTLSRKQLEAGEIEIRSELAEDLPVVVGDRVQLQQVILNLLLNAADAMSGVADRARLVVIRTEREDDDRARLIVRDTGVGIDPKNAELPFDAFYTTKEAGMGIGLSVSRSIIEDHNGRIWAAPNDGPGATFAFSVPSGADRGGFV